MSDEVVLNAEPVRPRIKLDRSRARAYRKSEYLRAFEATHCDEQLSYRHARISKWTVRLWRRNDPEFVEAERDIIEDHRKGIHSIAFSMLYSAKTPPQVRAKLLDTMLTDAHRMAMRLEGLGAATLTPQELSLQLAWANRMLESFVPEGPNPNGSGTNGSGSGSNGSAPH